MLQNKFPRQGRAEEKNTSTPNFTDPRPDLAEDSNLWSKFLESCWNVNPDLYVTVHGFRCCGVKLVKGKESYILRPIIGDSSAWSSQT